MIVMYVTFQVKPSQVEAFITATLKNAVATRSEKGNQRFEFYQKDLPHHFIILEIYKDMGAQDAHFKSPHFQEWRLATEDMILDSSGTSDAYQRLFPQD